MKNITVTICTVVGVIGLSAAAQALTLRVENWGDDANPCLSSSAPCRSISKAISVAVAGNTITVGPGLYSDDLDVDGIYGEPGEEPMTGIVVDRDVTIQSSDGASATLIRQTQGFADAVQITAAGATFGKKNKGFTLSVLEETNGIVVTSTGDNVEVAGNFVSMNPTSGVTAGSIGFTIVGDDALVHDNKVFCFGNSPQASFASIGYLSIGAGARFERNTALDCQSGFYMGGSGLVLTRNVAVGNSSYGFSTFAISEFTRNGAFNNSIAVAMDTAPAVFEKNSFVSSTNVLNCGFQNNSGGLINATNDFWGSLTGPGADPADDACNVGGGSTTVTAPFATTDFTQLQKPQR